MVLYNREIAFGNDSINISKVEYIPCEGIIIPLNFESIVGLIDQLQQTGFTDSKRVIRDVYIHFDEEFKNANLCIIYKNKKRRVVPKIGFNLNAENVDLLRSIVNSVKTT